MHDWIEIGVERMLLGLKRLPLRWKMKYEEVLLNYIEYVHDKKRLERKVEILLQASEWSLSSVWLTSIQITEKYL